MSNTSSILVSAATSAVVTLVAASTLFGSSTPQPSPQPIATKLVSDLAAVQEQCRELQAGLARANAVQPVRIEEQQEGDSETLRNAVQDILRSEGLLAVKEEPGDQTNLPVTRRPLAQLVADLRAADSETAGDLWAEIAACDRLAEVLDVYRNDARGAPTSVQAHHDLARALHAAALAAPSHKNGGLWGESDDAYTNALDIDPQNWDVRYEKAVKLTFWPDSYGRMPEAMNHFETLIEQHGSMATDPRQALVYLQLGNLHAQQGNREKAESIWRQGLQRHPRHESLQARMASGG